MTMAVTMNTMSCYPFHQADILLETLPTKATTGRQATFQARNVNSPVARNFYWREAAAGEEGL